MANGNRAVTFVDLLKLEAETIKFPELADPSGKKIDHGAWRAMVNRSVRRANSDAR